ncbi:zinc finger protein CONSTANS-LIKE 2 [Ricinus communis]|uniref:Zinc finger protein, putative n=1 Tax=Ricinus communis TaxID=3988 RepID=B9T3R7_RICCO|nr:zinc finger protein CONSTANS-LIKE 2 [Ricinus communis]EEF29491.1 zinc finger protein, putative [Ricinus communis]|eukprot:XP_002532886.1 zinc finger protein CONSTANS-LIKE 2 [Ricinus communis]
MLKEENTGGGGGNNWARVCDTCRAAACTVYCKADSAYLCATCDARIHAANRVASRHGRVWVCEACERAPAAFLCKADAASLCATCDADIHSANPLARRHQRVPIHPISGCLHGPQAGPVGGGGETTTEDMFMTEDGEDGVGEEEEDEAASWLLLNPVKNGNSQNNGTNGFLFGGEVEEYLDLFEYNSNSCGENQYADNHQHYSGTVHQKSHEGDSVVPVRCGDGAGKDHVHQQYHNFQLGLEFESSKAAYSYNGSISHSVSISPMDVGVVPDSTMSEASISHPRPPKGTIDLFSGPPIQMPSQLSPRDREARVLRYREKKKTRKFEKTIRYASRKAYAETRPRIKGRFAKRTDVEVEVDQIFSTALMAETGYGIVPSF